MAAAAQRTPTPEAVEFGEYLTRLWEDAGKPGWMRMMRTLILNTNGAVTVTDQQLSNYHAGKIDPRGVNAKILIALTRFYGCEAAALGPVAAAEIAAVIDLTSSDQPFAWSGCTGETAAHLCRN